MVLLFSVDRKRMRVLAILSTEHMTARRHGRYPVAAMEKFLSMPMLDASWEQIFLHEHILPVLTAGDAPLMPSLWNAR
jgi:hypothetical protein